MTAMLGRARRIGAKLRASAKALFSTVSVYRLSALPLTAWKRAEERRFFRQHGIVLDRGWKSRRQDARPRVLFVMNRDLGCDIRRGPSPYFSDCVGSLVSSGSGRARYFFMDHAWRYGSRCIARSFVNYCEKTAPDFIFYLPIQDLAYHAVNLPVETLMYVRSRLRIPLVTAIGDAWLYDSERAQQTRVLAEISDRLIVGEPRSPAFSDERIAPKLLKLWFPRDASLFHPGVGKRDIPLSFIGSLDGYVDRQKALSQLADVGIRPALFGPRSGRYVLTNAEIADAYRRSRMTINFTRIVDAYPIRGRVWEALLSGCLLFEEAGSSAEEFFSPGMDYVSFCDVDDLAQKIRYFQEHPGEAEAIARHGMSVAREKYPPERYWKAVFEAVEESRQK